VIEIQDRIREKFGLEAEVVEAANVLFLRVQGLDNLSLAEWIRIEFHNVYVSVKNRRTFEFSDDGWIKIEKNDNSRSNTEDTAT
jgi:hypothetical protein